MAHRLLFVEAEPTMDSFGLAQLVAGEPTLTLARTSLEALEGAGASIEPAALLLVEVDGDAERALRVFTTARRSLPGVPILALFREEPAEPSFGPVLDVASEVIFPPVGAAELKHRIGRLVPGPSQQLEATRSRLLGEIGLTNLVGRDPAFLKAIELLPRFARADVSVLITGETGTGKEVCARALHHLSRRRDQPFVVVDCGAVPESLFENELFGHARGAFTGADRELKGQVACAEGGTLLLDEIDALSTACQAKLLRFLQERTFRPLGSERVKRADVKVLAATNRDLAACVAQRKFRSDLYFRLNVLHVGLPPLRERRGDIELLSLSFLRDCAAWMESPPTSFSPTALRVLQEDDWPGNVRELANAIQRAAVTCEGTHISPCHLKLRTEVPGAELPAGGDFRVARAAAVAAFERRYVEELLRKHQGNVTQAAREARQDRRAFGRFIKKYQIDREAL